MATATGVVRHQKPATRVEARGAGLPEPLFKIPVVLVTDPYKPKEVAKYALSYMSSVWHHCNTAPVGEVVNSDFEVIGTKGLSIIDGSVMNQLTRLNPLATLLMFGM